MNIVVCIKQVPDTTKVRINPETNTLIREGVASIINPFDVYALEEALRLKEKHGGTTDGAHHGPAAGRRGAARGHLARRRRGGPGLRPGLRRLRHPGHRLHPRAAHPQARRCGHHPLGKQAIDGDTGQVGPGVAENLGLPHITDIRKIEEIADGRIVVERLLEDGYARLAARLPVVLTVVKEINEPRLPSLKGKMAAQKKEIPVLKAADLEADPERLGLNGSPTQVMKIFTPPKPAGGKKFTGEPAETVPQLLAELKSLGVQLRRKA